MDLEAMFMDILHKEAHTDRQVRLTHPLDKSLL